MLSVWSGIRPLVSDPNSKDTQSIARNHIITVGENNLITIAGGKWTTYRKMAEETVDKCVEVRKFELSIDVSRFAFYTSAHTSCIKLIRLVPIP